MDSLEVIGESEADIDYNFIDKYVDIIKHEDGSLPSGDMLRHAPGDAPVGVKSRLPIVSISSTTTSISSTTISYSFSPRKQSSIAVNTTATCSIK